VHLLLALGMAVAPCIGCHPSGRTSRANGKRFPAWLDHVGPVAFSHNGETLIVGVGNTAQLWSMTTRRQRAVVQERSRVTCLACSPDSTTLATGSDWGAVRLWDMATGKQKRVVRPGLDHDPHPRGGPPRKGPPQKEYDVCLLAYGPGGQRLTYVTGDMEAQHCDLRTGRSERLDWLRRWGRGAIISPDGKVVAYSAGTVKLFDLSSGVEKASLREHAGAQGPMSFSADGRLLACAGWDASVTVWDVGTGKLKLALPPQPGSPSSVVLSPDGRTLAVDANGEGTVRLWEVASGRRRKVLLTGSIARSVVFSPDGRHLAVVLGGMLELWDLASGERLDDDLPGSRPEGTAPVKG
jgi:WD40 repeat protein